MTDEEQFLLDEVKLAIAGQCSCTVGDCIHHRIRMECVPELVKGADASTRYFVYGALSMMALDLEQGKSVGDVVKRLRDLCVLLVPEDPYH